ncbi:hypothetical protein L2E82_35827 [Cichorium intybus]|uniref:Uncharacterized protein n=1 Tax=Cichorium intybus TaxID=13427 RepID=A0ACB9BPY4_CICIN|nr:hypothetical protein L2E82_35827 [Cichorium intybus]
MIPNTCVALNVIDIWIFILNHEELLKTKHKPKKVYCNVIHLKKEDFDEDADLEALYKIFEDNTNNTLKKCKIKNLKKVDLVFFPISHHSHYYVYVFDLNKKVVHLLDNIKNKKVGYYCKSPKRMVDFFSRYIAKMKHKSADIIAKQQVSWVEYEPWMSWMEDSEPPPYDLVHGPTIYAFTQSLPDLLSTLRQRRVTDNELINFIRLHRHYVFDAILRLHLRTSSPSHQNLSHHHIKPPLILGRHVFPDPQRGCRLGCMWVSFNNKRDAFYQDDKVYGDPFMKGNKTNGEEDDGKNDDGEDDDEESDDGEDENGESGDDDSERTSGSCMKI